MLNFTESISAQIFNGASILPNTPYLQYSDEILHRIFYGVQLCMELLFCSLERLDSLRLKRSKHLMN